jgi:hypothetical protein
MCSRNHPETTRVVPAAAQLARYLKAHSPDFGARGTKPSWRTSMGFVGRSNDPTSAVRIGAGSAHPTPSFMSMSGQQAQYRYRSVR